MRTPTSADLRSEAELEFLVISTGRNLVTDEVRERLFALVASAGVRTEIRLQAALTALIAADNTQDRPLADRAHAAIAEIDPRADGGSPHRDHFLLIYHNSVGNPRDALPAVRRLIEYARRTQDFGMRARYLQHAGHAYRMVGDLRRAHALYEEAFEIARAHYLYFRAECSAASLCNLGLDHGDLDEARKWLAIATEQASSSGRTTSYEEVQSCQAELCIREGRHEEARAIIVSLRPWSTLLNAARSTAHQLALETHLKLATGEKLSASECEALLSHYPKVAIGFRHDYFVAQLARGLLSAGRADEARQTLRRYVDFDRPSQDAFFADLVAVQQDLEASPCEVN